MGFWSNLFPGGEGALADIYFSNQPKSSEITLKSEVYRGSANDDTVKFSQLSIFDFSFNPFNSEVYLLEGNDFARTANTSSGTKFFLGAGDDFFTNNTAIPSTALGGAGNDKLRGGSGKDTLMGGDGNDKLQGNKGDDTLQGAAGNDTEIGGAGIDTLYGGLGDDSLSGAAGDDTLNGGSGDDWLEGGAGNDSASGDDGNDVQYGGTGNDSMKGGNGHDLLYGDDGLDTVEGEAGDDRLDGGSGDDSLRGGIGDDTSVDAEDNLDDVEGTEQEDSDDQRHGTAVTAVGVSFDTSGSAQITGSLADKRERQYFTFQAAADGQLSIGLLPGSNGGWAKLSLYNANGLEMIELDPSSRPRSTAVVAVVAGTSYTLRLRTPGKSAADFTVNLKLA